MVKKYTCIVAFLIISVTNSEACTECSVKAKNGNIWHEGNEDAPFNLRTCVERGTLLSAGEGAEASAFRNEMAEGMSSM